MRVKKYIILVFMIIIICIIILFNFFNNKSKKTTNNGKEYKNIVVIYNEDFDDYTIYRKNGELITEHIYEIDIPLYEDNPNYNPSF